jgi:hypothetical protein
MFLFEQEKWQEFLLAHQTKQPGAVYEAVMDKRFDVLESLWRREPGR